MTTSNHSRVATKEISAACEKWTKRCDDAKRIPEALYDIAPPIIQHAIDAATRDKDAEIAQLKACLSRCATACVELHGNEGEDAAALIAAIHAPHDRIDSTIHDVICGYECRAASAEHERDEARAEIERLTQRVRELEAAQAKGG